MSKAEIREPDQLAAGRNFKMVMSNGLIQSPRFNLSLDEQKIIFYLMSRIKPDDIELKEQVFEIREFCRICGMDGHGGANYQYLRRTLKNLRDKSVWMKLEDGSERTLSWISAVTISEHSGTVALKLDDMMKLHRIFHLKGGLQALQDAIFSIELKKDVGERLQIWTRINDALEN